MHNVLTTQAGRVCVGSGRFLEGKYLDNRVRTLGKLSKPYFIFSLNWKLVGGREIWFSLEPYPLRN